MFWLKVTQCFLCDEMLSQLVSNRRCRPAAVVAPLVVAPPVVAPPVVAPPVVAPPVVPDALSVGDVRDGLYPAPPYGYCTKQEAYRG